MKKILKDGFYISRADRLALANDLLDTLEEWAMKGPKYIISEKPTEKVLKESLHLLKAKKKQEGKGMPASEALCINELCALEEFKPRKFEYPSMIKPNRKQARGEKVLANGIDIEDHEYTAANTYWEDPEIVVIDLLENKIAMCKKRFVEEWTKRLMADPEVTEIPAEDDDLIEMVVLRPDYKNRATRQAEADALLG